MKQANEDSRYKITRRDCEMVLQGTVSILKKIFHADNFGMLAYGGYAGKWANGLSDLDAMLYFKHILLSSAIFVNRVQKFQLEMARLFEEINFLRTSNFFADVFIFDKMHGCDGRFLCLDKGFIERLLVINKNYEMIHGKFFLGDLDPVSLRQQEEFDLSVGLHKIRNYLFFEIPRLTNQQPVPQTKDVFKFLKVLPRSASIVLGKPINPIKEGLDFLSELFPIIDYAPLYQLYYASINCEALDAYLTSWHKPENRIFIDCWRCYETTLYMMLKYPMKSPKL